MIISPFFNLNFSLLIFNSKFPCNTLNVSFFFYETVQDVFDLETVSIFSYNNFYLLLNITKPYFLNYLIHNDKNLYGYIFWNIDPGLIKNKLVFFIISLIFFLLLIILQLLFNKGWFLFISFFETKILYLEKVSEVI